MPTYKLRGPIGQTWQLAPGVAGSNAPGTWVTSSEATPGKYEFNFPPDTSPRFLRAPNGGEYDNGLISGVITNAHFGITTDQEVRPAGPALAAIRLPQSADPVTCFILDDATDDIWQTADPNGYAADPAYTGPFDSTTDGQIRNVNFGWMFHPYTLPGDVTGAYVEARDATGYVLYRSRPSGAAWSQVEESAEDRAAYVISRPEKRWMVRAASAGNNNEMAPTRDNRIRDPVFSWHHTEYDRDPGIPSGGWHGQAHDHAGFSFIRKPVKQMNWLENAETQRIWYAYYICEWYGQNAPLDNKIKAEEVRALKVEGLADGLTFSSPLNLGYWGKDRSRLALDITDYSQALPFNLKCDAGLDISWSQVGVLPTSLMVSEYLDMTGSWVAEIPQFASSYLTPIRWKCDYSDLHTIVPDDFETLDFSAIRCPLHHLPDKWTVTGDLILDQTPIRELPADTIVSGKLSLRQTLLDTLPSNLECKVLDLTDAIVEAWPDNLPDVEKIVTDMDVDLIAELPELIRPKVKRHG